jgi:hypothetical protein
MDWVAVAEWAAVSGCAAVAGCAALAGCAAMVAIAQAVATTDGSETAALGGIALDCRIEGCPSSRATSPVFFGSQDLRVRANLIRYAYYIRALATR